VAQLRRVAQLSASHRTSIASRIDFAGAASFAFFFSAKGAGLDAALPNLPFPAPVDQEINFEAGGPASREQFQMTRSAVAIYVFYPKTEVAVGRHSVFVAPASRM
jgi:hypothetical protein